MSAASSAGRSRVMTRLDNGFRDHVLDQDVTGPDDFKGFKIAAGPLWTSSFKAFDARPPRSISARVYSALRPKIVGPGNPLALTLDRNAVRGAETSVRDQTTCGTDLVPGNRRAGSCGRSQGHRRQKHITPPRFTQRDDVAKLNAGAAGMAGKGNDFKPANVAPCREKCARRLLCRMERYIRRQAWTSGKSVGTLS